MVKLQASSPFQALKFRDFRLFWFGSLVSMMGNQMQTVAVAWQVYEITHSAAALGLIGIVQFLPILLFSLIGGVAADKLDRKKLLIFSQIVLALSAGSLALITHLNLIQSVWIYLVLFANATINAFSQPARQSVLPNLVPKEYFMNAVGLNTLQRQIGVIIGPAVAGFMIAGLGVQSIYLFNAVSFVFLLLTIIPIHVPAHIEATKASFSLKSIMEGIHFVRKSPILYSTMILDFLATFFGTANALMPIFAKDILHVGAQGLGLLYAAPSIGGILAGLFFSSVHTLKHQGMIIISAVMLYGLATIGFGLSKSLMLSLFFLSLTGAGDMGSTILRNTIRQMITPDHLRGRMVSVNMLFIQGGPRLGDAEAGFVAALIGAPAAVVVGGIGTIAMTALVAIFIPKLRKYQNHTTNA